MLKGVSPFVSTALIILLLIISISLAVGIGKEVIERVREANVVNEAIQNMKLLDNSIRKTAMEGIGNMKKISIKVSDGIYRVDEKTNSIEFIFPVKYGIIEPGTYVKENNLILACGANSKAYEEDLDYDGENELVLENEILKVGIQKVGSKDDFRPIDTKNNIKIMIFKENNATVIPEDSSIILDDFPETSYGYGYSKLLREGYHLPKAEALVHISSELAEYDIIYTLQSGADYLMVKILNAKYK